MLLIKKLEKQYMELMLLLHSVKMAIIQYVWNMTYSGGLMKNKNFIIIVIGQIISLFGNAIQRFSMSLYLLEFTGSTAAFSTILAVSTIPYIIFAPISGRLSDNINRKKI